MSGGDRARPLVVTGDPALLDELLRLAEAAGVELRVAVDAVAAADDWTLAPLVLVGADVAAEVRGLGLPRRTGVVVVSPTPQAPWDVATGLGAEYVAVLPDAQPFLVCWLADRGEKSGPFGTVVALVGGAGRATRFASALALAGRERGLDVLLIVADARRKGRSHAPADAGMPWFADGGPTVLAPTASGQGSVAVLSLERDQFGVPLAAMAAAIDAGRRGRDLILIDIPRSLDEAALLALTAADRGYLVVPAEVKACAAAGRVASAVLRHCPALAVVVRSVPGGLRPQEVGEALALPLAGVLPAYPRSPLSTPEGRHELRLAQFRMAELCRALLADMYGKTGTPTNRRRRARRRGRHRATADRGGAR